MASYKVALDKIKKSRDMSAEFEQMNVGLSNAIEKINASKGEIKEYGQKMKDLLVSKANNSGVLDKCSKDFGAIQKELDSYSIDKTKIAEAFDNIIKVLAEAENKVYKLNVSDKKSK